MNACQILTFRRDLVVAASFLLTRFLSDDNDDDDDGDRDDVRSSGSRRNAADLLINVRYKLGAIVAPVPFGFHRCWLSVNYLVIVTFTDSLPRARNNILK